VCSPRPRGRRLARPVRRQRASSRRSSPRPCTYRPGRCSGGSPTSWDRRGTGSATGPRAPAGDHHWASQPLTWAASRGRASFGVLGHPARCWARWWARPPTAATSRDTVEVAFPERGGDQGKGLPPGASSPPGVRSHVATGPLTFSRRASCRCSAVRCAAIGNLLSRISESSPTHRGSCVGHLNAPGETIEQPLTDQASGRWLDTRKETPGPAPQQQERPSQPSWSEP
jgi:hypothetical protein